MKSLKNDKIFSFKIFAHEWIKCSLQTFRFCEIFMENDLTDSVLTTPKYLQVQNVIVYLFVFQGELINLVKI